MANKYLPFTALATNAIPFDQPVTFIPQLTITGAVTFTKVTTGSQAGFGAIRRVVANGTNVPDLSAFKKIGSGDWVNTNGIVNQLWFVFDGVDYCVSITQPVAISGGGGGGGLTQLPTVSGFTATAISDTQINLTWTDEANESSYDIYVNTSNTFGGASLLINKAANSTSHSHTGLTAGTAYYYWIIAKGDGVTYSDSNTSTTNTTTTGGGGVGTDLSFTSIGSTITNLGTTWTPNPADTTYAHYAVSTTKRAAGTAAKVWFHWQYPGSTENFLMLMTTQVEGNAADGKVAFGTETGSLISSILLDGVTDHANISSEVAPLFLGFDIAADGTIKLQKSTDETSWTDLHTFTATYGGDLWLALRIYGGGQVNEPKATNFV
jgi:hypothetical protein